MDFVNIFISFSGRINRAKFWIAVVIFIAVNFVSASLALLGDGSTAIKWINGIISIVVTVSSFGVTIKRLHDRNKTGWLSLVFLAVPAILFAAGFMIGTMSKGSDFVATALWLVALAIWVWAFVELGCLRGSIGQNRFGPDPLAPEVLTPPVRTHA